MSQASLQKAIEGLGSGGLSLVVDDLAHSVSGARAIDDNTVEIYPLGDPDERPYRFDVLKVAKKGKGLDFTTTNRVALQLFPLGGARLDALALAFKDGTETLDDEEQA